MIKLYSYTLEEYNGEFLISENSFDVNEKISENEFISKSKYFSDRTYKTNRVAVCLSNDDNGYWQNTSAWVVHKEKQGLKRMADQLKQAILTEVENERINTDLMYMKMIKEYSDMKIEQSKSNE